MKAAITLALNRTIQSVNELTINNSNGTHKAPVCIVCNCLCKKKMLSWVLRKRLFDSRVSLVGEESLDDDVRKLYKYTGRGSTVWMDKVLLSPYASHKQFRDKTRYGKGQ
eukprot:scaffold199801_cov53-Attheya_sp.AAC.1